MKHPTRLTLPAGLALVLSVSVHAQITWAPPRDIQGVADISTRGVYFDAVKTAPGDVTPYTINGVIFHALTVDNYHSDERVSFSQNVAMGTDGDPNTGTPEYDALLKECGYVPAGATGSVTLSQLHSGNTYEIEIWRSDPRSARDTTLASGTSGVTLKARQYVLGTFVAKGTTETLTFAPAAGASFAELDAILLRDITKSPAR